MESQEEQRPDDFQSYWDAVLAELESTPAAPEVEKVPIRTTDFATLYSVRLTSIGPYRLMAYLSMPTGEPPFPALFFAPGYGSVVTHIPQGAPNSMRARYATFSVAARGMRGSEKPFEASFPGLFTEGIDSPDTYIFRGIVADACRAIEYLSSRSEVDGSRLAVIGGDVALIAAGLTGKPTHVAMDPGPFFEAAERAPATQGYPLQEINDYLRLHPRKRTAVERSLSYLDPRWFAPAVKAECRLTGGAEGEPLDRRALLQLLEAIEGNVTFLETEHSSYKDGLSLHRWIAEQFGFDEPILPSIW